MALATALATRLSNISGINAIRRRLFDEVCYGPRCFELNLVGDLGDAMVQGSTKYAGKCERIIYLIWVVGATGAQST